MSPIIGYLITQIRHRWQEARATGDAGYTTETVLVTALLIALAIVAIGAIALAVQHKADNLDLG